MTSETIKITRHVESLRARADEAARSYDFERSHKLTRKVFKLLRVKRALQLAGA